MVRGHRASGYLLLVLVAALSRRTGILPHYWLAGLVAISWLLIISSAGKHLDYYAVFWRPAHRLTAMLMGAALMSVGLNPDSRLPSWGWFLGAGLLLQVTQVPDLIKNTIGSALLATGCVRMWTMKTHPRWLCSRPLAVLGQASFSVQHPPVAAALPCGGRRARQAAGAGPSARGRLRRSFLVGPASPPGHHRLPDPATGHGKRGSAGRHLAKLVAPPSSGPPRPTSRWASRACGHGCGNAAALNPGSCSSAWDVRRPPVDTEVCRGRSPHAAGSPQSRPARHDRP